MLQSIVDALSAPVATLDETGRVVCANGAWRDAAARSPTTAGFGPDGYPDACDDADEDVSGVAALRDGMRQILAGRLRTFECNCQLVHEGSPHDYRVRVSRLEHDPARFLVEHEEVTETIRAQETLRQLDERLLEAQAEERQRLAVELHDSVGQNLVSLGLSLSRLRIVAPRTHGITTIISEMAASLQEAHAQIRSLSYLLNPPWPEHEGTLGKAVREFVEGFGRRAGLRVDLRIGGGSCELDRARELTIFRILQEALVNVHRHAHANVVVVELASQADAVMLRVTDDGRGFPSPEGAASPLGVGISGMQARVKRFGGELSIVSGPTGTNLTVKLPCRPGAPGRP